MANHVTIPDLEEPVTYTVGGTPQSEFDIPFPFFAASDILVYVDGEAVAAADFTVTGLFVQNGDPVEGAFGSGTMTLDTPVSNVDVTLDRFVGARREDDFSSAAPLSVRSVNTAIDKLTARDQDLRREFSLGIGGALAARTGAEAARDEAQALVANPPSFLTPSLMASLKVKALGSPALQTLESALWAMPTVKQWGALGDGSGDTVAEWLIGGDHATFANGGAGYANLVAIQADYPHVTSLADTIDWAAIQKAVNQGRPHFVPNGHYKVNREIAMQSFAGLHGEGNAFWQYAANKPAGTSVCRIQYTGPGGANTCVIRCSTQQVGVLPVHTLDESQSLRGVSLSGLMVDAGDVAEFGVYGARCAPGTALDGIVATGATRFGFWFGELFTGHFSRLVAAYNGGTGAAFGLNTFGWSTGNVVNAITVDLLLCYKNGLNAGYDDTTAMLDGVGAVLAWSRTCTITNFVGEMNYGPGLVTYLMSGPTQVTNLYLEDNCHFDPAVDGASATNTAFADGAAAKPWGWVHYNREAASGGDTVQLLVDTVIGAAPGGREQHIKLRGDKSAGLTIEPSEPVVIRSMYGVRDVDADFYAWGLEYPQSALIDANPTTLISRCLPSAGAAESVTGTVTTLYAAATATGDKSGRDTSNYITLEDALACARVNRGVTTINVAAFTSTSASGFPKVLDGRGFTRRMTLEGGNTARINLNATFALDLVNWRNQLLIKDMLILDRTRVRDSQVLITGSNMRAGPANHNTAGAALIVDGARVTYDGASAKAINVTPASTATRTGVEVAGGGHLAFVNPAAGTVVAPPTDAILFGPASGAVYVNESSGVATWCASTHVQGGGLVFAWNGVNP